jgi:hypothetical protein
VEQRCSRQVAQIAHHGPQVIQHHGHAAAVALPAPQGQALFVELDGAVQRALLARHVAQGIERGGDPRLIAHGPLDRQALGGQLRSPRQVALAHGEHAGAAQYPGTLRGMFRFQAGVLRQDPV